MTEEEWRELATKPIGTVVESDSPRTAAADISQENGTDADKN